MCGILDQCHLAQVAGTKIEQWRQVGSGVHVEDSFYCSDSEGQTHLHQSPVHAVRRIQ